MKSHLKGLLLSMSILPMLIHTPALADQSLDETQGMSTGVISHARQFARDTIGYVQTKIGYKVDMFIEDIARTSGRKAGQEVMKEIFKNRHQYGRTEKGDYVTLYHHKSERLSHALMRRFTGFDLDNLSLLPIPGGKQATKIILNKIEDYFAQNVLGIDSQKAIETSVERLFSYAFNKLKLQAQTRWSQQKIQDEINEAIKQDPITTLPTKQDLTQTDLQQLAQLDQESGITLQSVVDFYLAQINLGLDEMIRSTINKHILLSMDEIEKRSTDFGYSTTGMALTGVTFAINPILGTMLGWGVAIDRYLDLGGKQKFAQLLGIRRWTNGATALIQQHIAQTTLPLPKTLQATTQHFKIVDRGTQVISNKIDLQLSTHNTDSISKDWMDIEVAGDKHTFKNYVKHQSKKAMTQVTNAVNGTKEKTVQTAQAIKTKSVEAIQAVSNKAGNAVTGILKWAKTPFSWANEKMTNVLAEIADSLE